MQIMDKKQTSEEIIWLAIYLNLYELLSNKNIV